MIVCLIFLFLLIIVNLENEQTNYAFKRHTKRFLDFFHLKTQIKKSIF
jgi:hypothetical protein